MRRPDPADPRSFGSATDGAEVLRILKAVEHQQHGIRAVRQRGAGHRLQLPILAGTDIGDHALMRLRVRDVIQLAAVGRLYWDAPIRRQPSELPQSRFVAYAISQQQPFDWASRTERFEDGIATVNDVRWPRHASSVPHV